MSFGQLTMFLRSKAKLLFACFVVASMWAFPVRLSEIVTPTSNYQFLVVFMVGGHDRNAFPFDPSDLILYSYCFSLYPATSE